MQLPRSLLIWFLSQVGNKNCPFGSRLGWLILRKFLSKKKKKIVEEIEQSIVNKIRKFGDTPNESQIEVTIELSNYIYHKEWSESEVSAP